MTSSQNGDGLRERWLFLGSGLLLSAAVLVGVAREQRWGEPMLQLQFLSANAGGLRAGQEVRISGLPVGQVAICSSCPMPEWRCSWRWHGATPP